MRRHLRVSLSPILIFLAVSSYAASPVFEVASVKRIVRERSGMAAATRMKGGPGTADPGQITYRNVGMIRLLSLAYEAFAFQITGPEWLKSDTYDIEAKLPPGTTKEQFRVMLQNLLEERFHLAIRRETREVTGYELRLSKTAPKLRASGSGLPFPKGFPQLDHPGVIKDLAITAGGQISTVRLTAKAQGIEELARTISGDLQRPVIDKTGLTGTYDYNLEYSSAMGGLRASSDAPADEDSGPGIITAVERQLGLKTDCGEGSA